jgi:hypothetical protein
MHFWLLHKEMLTYTALPEHNFSKNLCLSITYTKKAQSLPGLNKGSTDVLPYLS